MKPQNKCAEVPQSAILTHHFSVATFFRGYLNSQVVRINKMVNSVNTILVFQDQPQGYILLYFYKLLRDLSLSRILAEFSLNLFCSVMCGKNCQIYGLHIRRKCIESRHFYSCPPPPPPPHSKLFPKFLSSHPRQREITHSPRQHFFENLFPPTTGRGRVNQDLLYQNLIRKYEDDLEHQIIYILYDS